MEYVRHYMNNQPSPCRLCPTVRFVCFWGELRPYAGWRRLAVLIAASIFAIGIPTVLWLTANHPNAWELWLIAVPLFLFSVLGLLGAIWGCNSCVVRLYGDV